MERKKITIDPEKYPEEIASFLKGANTYDSSCSEEARLYYIERKPGYFLKESETGALKAEYLMHDYFHIGVCDRHIDVLWGIWTLKFNLGTGRYTERFIDAYGRECVDTHKLRCIAAMEMFGG